MSVSRAERALVTDWWLSVDRVLLGLIFLLSIYGAAAALVATPQAAIHFRLEPFYFAKRQAIAMIFAFVIMIVVSLLTPPQIRRFGLILFGAGLLLMALALLQGAERNGATRWLILGGMVIQPSEFV
jgi:cell division protein FtsW